MMKTVAISLFAIALASPAYAAGDATAGRNKAQTCAGCHGMDGNAAIPNYPKLAGQHAGYLVKQLQDFKSGVRQDPIMASQVVNLSEQDMQDLAAYYAGQKVSLGGAPDKQLREMGERIYRGGIESKAVPACMACHGPAGAGNPGAKYPVLGGQNSDYVSKAMADFASGTRGGAAAKDSAGKIMHDIARRMSSDEIKAVSHYMAGLH